VLLVEVDALVSEVLDLTGELEVFVPGSGDGVAVGEAVELAVEVGELLVEVVEPVTVLSEAGGELVAFVAAAPPDQAASELVELPLVASDGVLEVAAVGGELLALSGEFGLPLDGRV
jgi:hypothetical protein